MKKKHWWIPSKKTHCWRINRLKHAGRDVPAQAKLMVLPQQWPDTPQEVVERSAASQSRTWPTSCFTLSVLPGPLIKAMNLLGSVGGNSLIGQGSPWKTSGQATTKPASARRSHTWNTCVTEYDGIQLISLIRSVLRFSKWNKVFFGYFDPENIFLDNENK